MVELGSGDPPKPKLPEIIHGYVVQARYTDSRKVAGEGRLVPFDTNDEDFDLRFRDFYINGFATRLPGAEEIHKNQLATGWQSRILPGVAEKHGAGWLLFTLH